MKDFYWLNNESRTILSRGYIKDGITPEERIMQIAKHSESISKESGFAEKFYTYMSNGWISLSSPIWANFGSPDNTALGISCYNSYVPDTVDGLVEVSSEIKKMTTLGGGCSAYYGDVRHRGAPISTGGYSDGTVHFIKDTSTLVDVFKQNETRRGACAVYLPIEHNDINEFLDICTDEHEIQNIQTGVCVSDNWLNEMKNGDYKKRVIWAKLLQTRSEIGFPYIFFSDNSNNHISTPEWYGNDNSKILSSNLCSEIHLPSNENESFVCCLSSLNILHYDTWKDTDLVETMTLFLDTVMEDFISKVGNIKYMKRAYNFAKNHRALGLGVLGYHSYLQSKNIPFESFEAKLKNSEIFKLIQKKSFSESTRLGKLLGEPTFLKGTGRRNTTTMAIAPTKTSSAILGQVSMGIEPLKSNYFVKDLAKIKMVYKNPFLTKLLDKYEKNDEGIWKSIMVHNGSVQHLDFLSDREKQVFKTFEEINPMEIIQQAAARQNFIDQGQSVNITIHPETSAKDLNNIILTAHELGVKALYYQNSSNASQNFGRSLITDCSSCEG